MSICLEHAAQYNKQAMSKSTHFDSCIYFIWMVEKHKISIEFIDYVKHAIDYRFGLKINEENSYLKLAKINLTNSYKNVLDSK